MGFKLLSLTPHCERIRQETIAEVEQPLTTAEVSYASCRLKLLSAHRLIKKMRVCNSKSSIAGPWKGFTREQPYPKRSIHRTPLANPKWCPAYQPPLIVCDGMWRRSRYALGTEVPYIQFLSATKPRIESQHHCCKQQTCFVNR